MNIELLDNLDDSNMPKLASKDFEFIQRELYANLHKKQILAFLKKQKNKTVQDIASFLEHNKMTVFPYNFVNKYNRSLISCKYDTDNKMYYICNNNIPLYAKPTYKNEFRVKRYFSNLMMEQDINSPHRYTTNDFKPTKDCVLLDIGGAEGFFAAKYLDVCKKIYVFECDENWLCALNQTFSACKDKVVIINKYVTDYCDDNHISLDKFIESEGLQNENLFVKADCEGYEPWILRGMKHTLTNSKSNIKLAICTYHSHEHEALFRSVFDDWQIESSKGYMLYYYDFDFRKPYLRRGLLRIQNNN